MSSIYTEHGTTPEQTIEPSGFNGLPREIRFIIWRLLANHEHQVLKLWPSNYKVPGTDDDVNKDNAKDPEPVQWKSDCAPSESIMRVRQICRESNQIVQEHCPRWEGLHSHSDHIKELNLLLNLASTTVHLFLPPTMTIRDVAKQFPRQVKLATSLVLDFQPHEVDLDKTYADILSMFQSLRFLVVLGRYRWPWIDDIGHAFDVLADIFHASSTASRKPLWRPLYLKEMGCVYHIDYRKLTHDELFADYILPEPGSEGYDYHTLDGKIEEEGLGRFSRFAEDGFWDLVSDIEEIEEIHLNFLSGPVITDGTNGTPRIWDSVAKRAYRFLPDDLPGRRS
ncbi:hypothetical protein BJ878DRAFT_564720 [Calycina marina]|uniref:2EXR domain-containing protein n=1 Tax=Calycina marina TaxID=1763456 RepID=A0A9P7Z9L1_9HELO|nr:hypothetical protein BJ878DRAFT_564720 [Calycina marina]